MQLLPWLLSWELLQYGRCVCYNIINTHTQYTSDKNTKKDNRQIPFLGTLKGSPISPPPQIQETHKHKCNYGANIAEAGDYITAPLTPAFATWQGKMQTDIKSIKYKWEKNSFFVQWDANMTIMIFPPCNT